MTGKSRLQLAPDPFLADFSDNGALRQSVGATTRFVTTAGALEPATGTMRPSALRTVRLRMSSEPLPFMSADSTVTFGSMARISRRAASMSAAGSRSALRYSTIALWKSWPISPFTCCVSSWPAVLVKWSTAASKRATSALAPDDPKRRRASPTPP